MNSAVSKLIEHYHLIPHFEGGYFRETYRSTGSFSDKSYSSAILYLLENGQKSRLHRIKSDEMWHYYTGNAPLELVMIENNRLKTIKLGHDIDQNQVVQAVVPAGVWFGAYIQKDGYALMGCTVSPGFDVVDYEVMPKTELDNSLYQLSKEDLEKLEYLMR